MQHYQGDEAEALRQLRPRRSAAKTRQAGGQRIRTPSRFDALGIPIGSELTFVQDRSKRVIVCDEVNQVEYQGIRKAVSAMTRHFMKELGKCKSSGAYNGFNYFAQE